MTPQPYTDPLAEVSVLGACLGPETATRLKIAENAP